MSELIARLGGPTSLAKALGIKAPSVIGWGGRIPASRCPDVERLRQGEVSCEELRPDIAWHRVPDADWPWHPQGRPMQDHTRRAPAALAQA